MVRSFKTIQGESAVVQAARAATLGHAVLSALRILEANRAVGDGPLNETLQCTVRALTVEAARSGRLALQSKRESDVAVGRSIIQSIWSEAVREAAS